MDGTTAPLIRALLILLGVVASGFLALQLLLSVGPSEVTGSDYALHQWWYMGRSSGFVAYGLLTASVILGLGLSTRAFDGVLLRPWVYDMHEFLSIFVVVVMCFHALVMLPDPYSQFRLIELLVPFASPYRPFAVGVGAIAFYGSIAVTASFYLKSWIGYRGWRALHYLSFALFGGALLHGVLSGADTGEAWAQLIYIMTGLMVVALTCFRIIGARTHASPGSQPRSSGQLFP